MSAVKAGTADAGKAKKRRSFFSSNLPIPPIIATASTSRLPVVPRAQVLAALSAPEELPPPPARPRREAKAPAPIVTSATPASDEITGSRLRTRQPPPPAKEPATPPARTLRQRTSTKSLKEPEIDSPPPLLKSPSRTNASKRKHSAIKSPVAAPSKKGKEKASTKDENAQSVNERLSVMMMQSMRATIGGREKPYERVPVWKEKERRRRKQAKLARKSALAPSKRPSVLANLTARQKKMKTQRAQTEEEEEEEEFADDDGESGGEEHKQDVTPKKAAGETKKYMNSGFYCQDANAKSPYKLVNKVLGESSSSGRKTKASKNALLPNPKRSASGLSFPPLPYDHGYDHFFGKEHDFLLPYQIHKEATGGALNDKKKPAPYQKIRGNVFPERGRQTTERALCRCDSESDCGDNCINRIMSYICGKDCPCGDKCTNKSLTKRTVPETKVKYTGSRGFGLFALQDIKEGDLVIDYRGEVISLDTFHERLDSEYAGQKNFYALAYDQAEVIDAGMRGNDARFINHGCDPNLEVRKYQTLGDGYDEFEVGMWALRDIKQGEELFYNYNFDWFGEAEDNLTAECRCGASNCIGFLGRKNDRSAAILEMEAKKAAEAARAAAKSKRGKKAARKVAKKGIKFTAAVDRAKKAAVKDSGVSTNAPGTEGENAVDPSEVDELDSEGDEAEETSHDIAVQKPATERQVEGQGDGAGENQIADSSDDWIDIAVEVDTHDLPTSGAGPAEGEPATTPEVQVEVHTTKEFNAAANVSPAKTSRAETKTSHRSRTSLPSALFATTVLPPRPAASELAANSTPFGAGKQAASPEPGLSSAAAAPGASKSKPKPSRKAKPDTVGGSTATPDPTSTAASQSSIDTHPNPPAVASSSTGNSAETPVPDAAQSAGTDGKSVTPGEEGAKSRKSGWANWLRKIAAERPRTLEEWHEERMKRRRGIAWMNQMIAEFGIAPSAPPTTPDTYIDGRKPAGSVGSFANTLAAQGHGPGPEGVRNLGGPKNMYRSDNFKRTKEEQMRYAGMTPGGGSLRSETPIGDKTSRPPGSAPPASTVTSSATPKSLNVVHVPSSAPHRRPSDYEYEASSSQGNPGVLYTSRDHEHHSQSHSPGVHLNHDVFWSSHTAGGSRGPVWARAPDHLHGYGHTYLPGQVVAPAPADYLPSDRRPRTVHDVAPYHQPPQHIHSASNHTSHSIYTSRHEASASAPRRPYWQTKPATPARQPEDKSTLNPTPKAAARIVSETTTSSASAKRAGNAPEMSWIVRRPPPPPAAYRQPSSTANPLDASVLEPSPSHSGSQDRVLLDAGRKEQASNGKDTPEPAAHIDRGETEQTPVSSSPISRESSKKQAIQKRNGAPMGWVYTYEAPSSNATRMGELRVDDLPRSARRARQSLVNEEHA